MCVKIQAVVRMFLVRSRRLQVLAKATSLDRVYTYAAKPARRDPAPNWIALGACERMRFAYREKTNKKKKKKQGHNSFALSCPGEHMCVVLPVYSVYSSNCLGLHGMSFPLRGPPLKTNKKVLAKASGGSVA